MAHSRECLKFGPHMIEVPQRFRVADKHSLITQIFGQRVLTDSENMYEIAQRAILTPTNDAALDLNDQILQWITHRQIKTYRSGDSIERQQERITFDIAVENLNQIRMSGLAPHELKHKVGSIVLLMPNFDRFRGLMNDTRLVVKRLCTNSIVAEVLTGSHRGDTVALCRLDLCSDTNTPKYGFILRRRQFPLLPAFAMAINKAQGQSLQRVGVYLPTPVFTHGQLYVACSRSRNPDFLKICVQDTEESSQGKLISDEDRVFTKNIVDPYFLRDD